MTTTSTNGNQKTFTDFGQDMWSYLTGQEATIDYTFVDMAIEVPHATGSESAHATWRLNGTLRVTTSDKDNRGALNAVGV